MEEKASMKIDIVPVGLWVSNIRAVWYLEPPFYTPGGGSGNRAFYSKVKFCAEAAAMLFMIGNLKITWATVGFVDESVTAGLLVS